MCKKYLHPKWSDKIQNTGQIINWFLYCTGPYTDQGQQNILKQLSIQGQHLAWRASSAGYVELADPVHNIAIIYPQPGQYDSYTYPEKDILKYAF